MDDAVGVSALQAAADAAVRTIRLSDVAGQGGTPDFSPARSILKLAR